MKEKSNLIQRILTAMVALPIIVGGLYWSAWSYFALFLILTLLTLHEFYQLLEKKGYVPLTFWGLFFGGALYSLRFLHYMYPWPQSYQYLLLLPIPWLLCVSLYKQPHEQRFTSIAYTVLGLLYIGVPFASLHELAFLQGEFENTVIMGFVFMFFINDSAAFFAGRSLGRKKLFQRISPKKSWEGAIAGVLATMVFGYIWGYFFNVLSKELWVALAGVTSVCSIYGDLVASFFKRSIHVKDSSNLLPGHGGFLDRFDNMLVAAPVAVVVLKIFIKI